MSDIVAALSPVLLLISFGFFLRLVAFLSSDGWVGLERLTYYILLPALLIRALSSQSLAGTAWLEMLTVVTGTLLVAAAALVICQQFLSRAAGSTFTSIFQGGVRFNTYIALAVAEGFYGGQGLAFAAVTAGFMVVIVNLLCITVFRVWGAGRKAGERMAFREVLANPLLIGCAIGWTLSASDTRLPHLVNETLDIIGAAGLPLGLLTIGAALNLRALHDQLGAIANSCIIQFGLKPAVTVALVTWNDIAGVAANVLIIVFMVPTAPSGYILARQLGGDAEVVSSIITSQTLLAFVVMPLLAALLLS